MCYGQECSVYRSNCESVVWHSYSAVFLKLSVLVFDCLCVMYSNVVSMEETYKRLSVSRLLCFIL